MADFQNLPSTLVRRFARKVNVMRLPLEGLLVVAVEQAVAAPMCTLRLADAGARVIKVERQAGDTARHYDKVASGTSAYFAWLNRGKESVTLDLKATDDVCLLRNMLSKADIFVQNLVPGAMARLGLGHETLSAQYPSLITVDIVGYGSDTAYRAMRAYDMLVQAETGLCSVTGTEDTPSKVGVSVADICTGMNAHAAILEALLERARTGRGKNIEISMFDGLAEWMAVPLMHFEHLGRESPRVGLSHAQIYPYGTFQCLDGEVVVAVQNAEEWQKFCVGILKHPELIQDRRFIDNPSRVHNRVALDEYIRPVFARVTRSSMVDCLEANGLAWGRRSTLAELTKHPALHRARVQVPGGAMVAMVSSPLRRSDRVVPVPALNEHAVQIRAEFSAA